ncbi:Polynucleotide 5'-hydroxyl-kinase grc3 [Ceratobasidium sp. 414]|nr:Polynucleotide 5'-hydroxyl-kinase grc3 [Ceratobasidium sp. 414]
MASNQVLSAVARRRAALLETSANSDESTKKLLDTTYVAKTPADLLPSVPLKRKTSVVSLKGAETLRKGSQAAKQSRKRSKAEWPTQDLENGQQVSTSSVPQRAYSPSQPVVDSSDEDQPRISPGNHNLDDFGAYMDQEEDPVSHPRFAFVFRLIASQAQPIVRAQRILRNIFNPVDRQSLISLSAEETFSIAGQSVAACLLVMQPGESLVFVGTMYFVLLQGRVELMGVPLLPSKVPHRVFAPRSHPIPVVSVPPAQETVPARGLPATHRLSQQLPQRIRGLVAPTHSVILAWELPSGVEGLGRIMHPFKNLFEPDARDTEVSHNVTKGLHVLKAEPQYDQLFYLPRDWELALDDIVSNAPKNSDGQEAPVILVKGGKNSGKSTFSRTLANRLINIYRRVAFVECDLGQSEFTPGGMVSLNVLTAPVFGPSFTHLSIPRCAHFIGGTSPKTSPSHYLAALNDLSQQYRLELKYSTAFNSDAAHEIEDGDQNRISTTIPLVINTQGWVKGMGADLLRSIEHIFEPSHIVDFHVSGTSSNPGTSPFSRKDIGGPLENSSTKQISVAAIPPPLYPPRFSAADMRGLALISYFHARFSQEKSADYLDSFIEYWDTSLSLRAVAPIIVDPDLALESITIAAPGGDDVVLSELSKALVCGVVGLVAPESAATRTGAVYTQGALPPSPQTSRCVGLGFIRGASDTKIQLLTPTPVQELKRCRNLVLGELSMPVWAFLDSGRDNYGENDLPYLQWGRSVAESAGGERRRIRRNVMRRSQA